MTGDPTIETSVGKWEQPIEHPGDALPGKQSTGAPREFKKELTARWRYLLRKNVAILCHH